MSETVSYLVTDALLLIIILAGPWLHAFTRRKSPAWLNTSGLVLALLSLMWWGLPYGAGSAGCWLEFAFDGTDQCTAITDYIWVPVVIAMFANIIVGAVHQGRGSIDLGRQSGP